MKRFYRLAAPGLGGVVICLTLTSAGLAVSYTPPPNSNITGAPAHWMPTKLTAKGLYTHPIQFCTISGWSFTMTNKEKVAETVTWSYSPKSSNPNGGTTLGAGQKDGLCDRSSYKGTLTVKLSDGKVLKVKYT